MQCIAQSHMQDPHSPEETHDKTHDKKESAVAEPSAKLPVSETEWIQKTRHRSDLHFNTMKLNQHCGIQDKEQTPNQG